MGGLSTAKAFVAGVALLGSAAPVVAKAEPVLLISIDGLRPGDILEAEKRGLKVPNLRRFLKDGAYAAGVTGNLPTVTYPSHTTLITGVAPARHGIVSNNTFDPKQINYGGWYWYAQDIKAETLWDAAHKAGLSTGNVHWPVSVGTKALTWNLPQIWRSGHGDDRKLLSALSTDGLYDALEHDCGAYAGGIDEGIDADETRAKFAARLIETKKPQFTTVYLAALDHEEHLFGPGSPQANAVLERLDAAVGKLVAAELAAHPDATVAVVSDHGFVGTDTEINLFRPFIDAGLIKLGADGKVATWEAMPWSSGGSVAVVLARPADAALTEKVGALLRSLAGDPQNRIARVVGQAEITKMGGNPEAAFFVDLKPGALAGGFAADAPLVKPSRYKGMHGYFPAMPEMRSTFLIMGKGVAAGRNLGEIDMRAIAPTLAAKLGVALTEAQAKPLVIAP
ncbi:putative AlkP superfamily pyrophosphatase or phosphodiesterase [Novosphingobium hassiacum]|uniref:Putative AlkP superfamily pyrophosphatase or phosphodiesterase n=1 Tax=Novosphingobium hassiacum TaxID=173676 RepID=A0A7W6EXV0_9SPHN|nr:ectonucleotide pyrophosphatase/phosphodiesterase [Novosphingobium hassiacum]MBB3862234.1 putative AlkP superfamily pyrophosphatase or phosphodiesterase [Novosphingobium hassiacum]